MALFFAFPLVADPRAGARRSRQRAVAACRDGAAAVVHDVAGRCLDGAHDRPRAAARLGGRTVQLPRPRSRPRARAGAVRPPHGRGRDGVPRAAARPATSAASGRSSPPTCSSTSPSSPASSAAAWATVDPPSGEAAAVLGAGPLRRAPRDHAAAAGSGPLGGGGADVPLLLHVVRRHPDPRRARPRDARDGDLQPGGAALRPPGRGRARRSCSSAPSPSCSAVAEHPRGACRQRGDPRRTSATCSAGRRGRPSGSPLVVRARRWQRSRSCLPLAVLVRAIARELGRALRRDPGAARRALAGGRLLDRLRGRRGA